MIIHEKVLRAFLREKGLLERFEQRVINGNNLVNVDSIQELVRKTEKSPNSLITAGFVWERTDEGQEYWAKTHRKWMDYRSNVDISLLSLDEDIEVQINNSNQAFINQKEVL